MIGVRWVHDHSYRCSVCRLPRFIIRRDHTSCLEYSVEQIRRDEVARRDTVKP